MTAQLSDEEAQAWRCWISASRRLYDRLGQELQAHHGLSMADYEILVRLADSDDQRARMSDLAESTVASRSRLSHQIDRMERQGLVCREGCPEDRRGLYAVLTDGGRDLLSSTEPFHIAGVREHFFNKVTTRDVTTLARICDKINNHLDDASPVKKPKTLQPLPDR